MSQLTNLTAKMH